MRGARTAALAAALAIMAAPARAHVGSLEDAVWSAWHFSAGLTAPTLLIAAIYIAGLRRRRRSGSPGRTWRHVAFVAGLLLVPLALQSPLDAFSDRLFSVHQAEHLLLRMIAPVLIVIAAPQATLLMGLPNGVRRTVVPALATSVLLRGVFAPLAHPVGALVFFVGAAYVWQIPSLHDRAVQGEDVHTLMHATLIASALFFWWRAFESRTAPPAASHRVRLMMMWLALLTNILLGAWLTLKSRVLYTAYDVPGRAWGITGSSDERIGGAIIWIAGSMMLALALMAVIHSWGRHEDKLLERRTVAGAAPVSGGRGAAAALSKSSNQRLAIGLAAFSLGILGAAFAVGILAKIIEF